MKRTHLFYSADHGTYYAGTFHDSDYGEDVTSDKQHERKAVLQGEWIGGNPLPRDLCAKETEHGEQAALFAWAAACSNVGICNAENLRKMYAIPNGGKRDPKTAAMLKAEGVKVGVPDVCLPCPVVANMARYDLYHETQPIGGYMAGLYIEMKKVKGGSLSSEQKERIEQLQGDGYAAVRCNGWREAARALIAYLDLTA